MLIFAHTNINNFLSFKAFCLISTYTLIFLPSLLYRSQGNLRLPPILQALNIKHLFEVLYLRDKITIELRLELNQMSSCRTSQINQSISRSIDHSINQSNCLMANASSMILSQEACWNDTTYRKHMQTNLDIYDEIHAPNCYCCLVNSSRGRFSNSLFYFLRKMILVSQSLL